jgi:hypothetical protein
VLRAAKADRANSRRVASLHHRLRVGGAMIPSLSGTDLSEVMRELAQTGRHVKVLWQEEESLAFVSSGRDYRSEFHRSG